jgi:hypothetical protein
MPAGLRQASREAQGVGPQTLSRMRLVTMQSPLAQSQSESHDSPAASLQSPRPSQTLVPSQSGVSTTPRGKPVHMPTEPSTLQAMQVWRQSLLQQTPSMHFQFRQSSEVVHS